MWAERRDVNKTSSVWRKVREKACYERVISQNEERKVGVRPITIMVWVSRACWKGGTVVGVERNVEMRR